MNAYQCQLCTAKFVVPSLARDCETRHEADQ